ncbi:arf-GAP with GTPase, ANK repeat and PH domain-containing protein 3-like [Engraulis encrasicolus]|uniref:arf-GAP with GTPase, ANK repeat and PH domain-containing protein 3-like n=1 Tax=Engraulis encrasicolus TaxID=184585 RepID=UPI002FD687DE
MNYQSSVPVSVSVSGISQQSQPAMPTPGTVPAPVPVPVPQSVPAQFGSGSSASSGAGQFGSGTVSGQAAQSGPPGSQFVLSNSAAIRAEIHRFESVHPNIYAIYDLIERIDDLALQNQIREHVISIEAQGRPLRSQQQVGDSGEKLLGKV